MNIGRFLQKAWQVIVVERRVPYKFEKLYLEYLRLYINFKFIVLKTIFKKFSKNATSDSEIYVACVINDNYAMPLAAMLRSMFFNLKKGRKVTAYIFFKDISVDVKKKLEDSTRSENLRLLWIKLSDEGLKDMRVEGYLPVEVYFRVLLTAVLPKELEKIIYLDADIIFNEDIGKLWDIDIDDKYVLAVQEIGVLSRTAKMPASSLFEIYEELKIPPDTKVFNAGILVMNLPKWEEEKILEKTLDVACKYKKYMRHLEQSALNVVLAGRWGELDPRWNLSDPIVDYCIPWKMVSFDEEPLIKLAKSPYAVHYSDKLKPWHKDSKNPYRDLFFFYLDMTEWRNWRP